MKEALTQLLTFTVKGRKGMAGEGLGLQVRERARVNSLCKKTRRMTWPVQGQICAGSNLDRALFRLFSLRNIAILF